MMKMLRKITMCALLILCSSVVWSQTISDKTTKPCSGDAYTVAPVNGVGGDVVPGGTVYTWPIPAITGSLSGTGMLAGNNAANISGTLTNSSTSQQVATYTVTPSVGGVPGTPFTVTVIVNPFAVASDIDVTAASPVICGGLSTTLTASIDVGSNVNSGTATFIWYSNAALTAVVGSGATFTTGILNSNSTYYVSVSSSNACANVGGTGKSSTITVSGQAPTVVLPASQVLCAGLSATSPVIFTSSPVAAGTIYTWSNTGGSIGLAASGTGDIPSFTPTNGGTTILTATIVVTPFTTTNSCSGLPKTFTIQSVPIPVASSNTITTCSGSAVSYSATGVPSGTKYTWYAVSPPASITTPGGFTQNTSQSSFNPTLNNSSNASVDVVFIVTPNTGSPSFCPGNPFTLTVTVKPTPAMTASQFTTTCSGVPFLFSPTGTIIPSTISYSWTIPALQSGTATGLGSSGPSLSVTGTLTNTGTTNAIVKYTITPTSSGCTGNVFTGTVTVYPKPTLTVTTSSTICNGANFSYTPTSLTSPVDITWSRVAVNNISNAAMTGTNGVNETLTNTGTGNETVTYAYTLSLSGIGCPNTQNISVTVKPALRLSSDLTRSTCSNSAFTYNAVTATAFATTLAWSRTAVTGISNADAGGGNSVNETLINTTSNPINVTYQYHNTSAACSDITNVVVTVNPLPTVNTIANQVICSGATASLTLTGSAVTGTVYNWANSNSNIGLTNSGQGNISFLAYDATYVPILGTVTVTPNANSCNGTPLILTVTVNPSPTLSSDLTISAVCSGLPVAYTPTSAVSGTTYNWSRPGRDSLIGINNNPLIGSGGVRDTLINSSNVPLQVPYNYVLSANGCTTTQLVNVTVNPVPTMFNPGNQLACNNSTKVINFSGSIVSGTSYFWNNDNTAIGVPAVGTGDIFFVASTNSPDSVYANITARPQAYGCTGPEVAFRIIINPPLSLNSSLTPAAVCSNSLFGYTPSSTAANPIYIWNRNGVNGISNSPASGSGSIQEILINTTSSPISVAYDYTLSSNGCVKNETVTVSIIPALVLNNSNLTNEACSGSAFTFSPNGNITGVSYLWSRAAVTGITNAAASGTGDVNETLVNSTDAAIEVLYRYSLGQGGSCAADQLLRVTVKPLPKLTGSKSISACSNAPVAYTPVGNIPGTNFNWSRAAVAGISNTPAVGLVGISESLINSTTAAVNAVYIYNMTNYNGCSNTEQVTVQVKPAPVAGVNTDQSICADDITKAITFTSNITGTTFNWTNSEPSIGLAASGTGATIPAFKSVNTSSGQLVAIIQVNPVANGCTGNTVTAARITVNRAITTSFIESQPSIACPGQLVGPFVASVPLGGDGSTYLFQWQVSTDSLNYTNIPGATARQLIAPAITKDAWYRMNTVSLGCSAVTPLAKVLLKAKPVITVTNRDGFAISIGNSTQVVATGAKSYIWSPPLTVSDFRSASPFLNPIVTTKYTVLGTTEDGCSDSTSITILVNAGYQITPNNILTPNGDGINDTWKVKNIEYYPDNSVKVYNSNSILVWQKEKYDGTWNGTDITGVSKLASGTYYYIISLKPQAGSSITADVLVKGYLTILN